MMRSEASGMRKRVSRLDDDSWTRDPEQYPAFRAISPGMMFYRRVLVYRGPEVPLEFLTVSLPPAGAPGHPETMLKMVEWNMQWEAGPYRAFDTEDLPTPLTFIRGLEASADQEPSSDVVLIPGSSTDIYEKWAPLYHLLPRATLMRHKLPVLGRGCWPMRGAHWRQDSLPTGHHDALSRAFAEHLWRNGLGPAGSPLGAFTRHEPMVLLSHDLGYWLPHMEKLMRSISVALGRVRREDGDSEPESILKDIHVSYEMPTFGGALWTGEEEAAEMTRDLIDLADENGRLRSLFEAVRSNRVEDDFSARWSYAREDFERKLYRKRSKTKVSFVEFDDSLPFFDGRAELHGNLLCRDLLALVDPKDRHVVICLHSGITRIADIAKSLGYANHSPISKSLERIRKRARRLLDD